MADTLTIAFGIVLGWSLILIINKPSILWFAKDDTDGKKRSGFVVLVDYKTGIQYLMSAMGGITPRLDRDGKPMIDEGGEG